MYLNLKEKQTDFPLKFDFNYNWDMSVFDTVPDCLFF